MKGRSWGRPKLPRIKWARRVGVVVAAAVLLAGCAPETRAKALSFFFDGVPKPGQEETSGPLRRRRADLLREIEELKRDLVEARNRQVQAKPDTAEGPPAEQAKTWEEASDLLPRDPWGNVDWIEATGDELMKPRPGPAAESPEQPVIDIDVEIGASQSRTFAVTFPHRPHTTLLTCGSCHPTLFPLRKGGSPITMRRIFAGEACGACHGKVAFPIEKSCPRCHTLPAPTTALRSLSGGEQAREAMSAILRGTGPLPKSWDDLHAQFPKDAGGGVDWVRALADGKITPLPGPDRRAEDRPVLPMDVPVGKEKSKLFRVSFPHASHTQWVTCTSCHPEIFQMARGTTPITMARIMGGEACGVCHGKVAFSVSDRCARCHQGVPASAPWTAGGSLGFGGPDRPAVERTFAWPEAAKVLPAAATGGVDWNAALDTGTIRPRPGIDPKAPDQPVLPIDVEMNASKIPTFKAVFPHAAHTQWLGCANCHLGIFQMARGTTQITMARIMAGEACGVCHGKVAFEATACARCHPASAAK